MDIHKSVDTPDSDEVMHMMDKLAECKMEWVSFFLPIQCCQNILYLKYYTLFFVKFNDYSLFILIFSQML